MTINNNAAWQAVGERLRAVRTTLQRKAEPFALSLGISRGYLSELENGKRQISGKVLSALAREYGVNGRYLTHDEKPVFNVKKLTNEPAVFFGQTGKQVSLNVEPTHLNRAEEPSAADAYASAARGTSYATPVIAMVIAEVLKNLNSQRLELEPEKTAELIMLIYDDIVEGPTESGQVTKQQVTNKTQRLMRLVA